MIMPTDATPVLGLYRICTGMRRNEAFFPVFCCIEKNLGGAGHHKIPIFQRGLWWARQGLNLRPHPCEGCALPLSYAPRVRRGRRAL